MRPHPMMPTADNDNVKRILDYLKISYWLVDMNFVLLDVNETFLDLTGARREKLIGRDMRTLITPEEGIKVQALLTALSEEKEPIQFELYVYGRKHRQKIPVLFHLSVNVDPAGQPSSANVLLVDISGQKEIRDDLEKEKKVLQTILFGIRDCVAIFDHQGRFMLGNPESLAVHAGRKTALLPLDAQGPARLDLEVNRQNRQYIGEVRPIFDHAGELFAYAETLTDITNHVRLKEKERELFLFRRQLRRRELQTEMIGASKIMQAVLDTILRCAEVDSSVLIMGETGVGKEVAARAIHAQSQRRAKPFVSVNCAALPEALLESELFGHVKGAFTGASANRGGLFREAHAGTLFLDEIGELNKAMQVKLLRVLQEKEVRPVGADRSYPVDVRIICATNRDLKGMTDRGEFRLDLYYRIAVIPLVIPPLRERAEDIFRLVEHFIRKHQKGDRRRARRLDLASRQLLSRYPWPGNIRELENAIEHALAMSRSDLIPPECFPPQVLNPQAPGWSGVKHPCTAMRADHVRAAKRADAEAIARALARHGGNQSAAARELGISRVTLWRKKSMYNL